MAEPAVHELVKAEPVVEIVWRAFELRPEQVPTLVPKGDYLQRAWSTSVYPLAERLGVTMKLPPVQPRTRLAHEAAHWARMQGRFDDYHAEVFRAFFERGEDIGDVDVLASLALELGLDSASLRLALKTREFEESVLKDEREAASLGVTGVPAFIANRKAALSGVQPVENLKKLVERVRGVG
ncbi:MAG TPA: disulfide bond formation protein DsbA [Blastocatellia bacterium]|nr:disulfide bond formation protein DsbA [Blastocatellia bacterium]